ncbi:oocyte zinc finger protein XlCOF28-like isoform X3 [Centruroides sculpturatus]|uniref:oocyte zinc finger protein XlCOF28-like isoform X3 n=1 Tax=Centruroides sculpturatus TaxID=218467 RepID=UPI000C6C97C1|nr:oocyte zinc finger protein XlCOF28-like isoform X3 [Centruroides sculpturatus]
MAAVTSDSKNVIECKICKNQYRNQQLFDDHLKNNPACSKLTCDVCQKQYMYVKSLNFHKKTHLKEKPFKCDECEYSTISKSLLNRHQLTHSRKLLYNCKYCGWPTSRKSTLDGHIFVVHYEQLSSPDELPPRYRDLKKYSCKLCKQRCQSEYALKEHMRTHTGERPFQCDICLRKYVTKSNLKVHMRAKHSRQKFTSEVIVTHLACCTERIFQLCSNIEEKKRRSVLQLLDKILLNLICTFLHQFRQQKKLKKQKIQKY